MNQRYNISGLLITIIVLLFGIGIFSSLLVYFLPIIIVIGLIIFAIRIVRNIFFTSSSNKKQEQSKTQNQQGTSSQTTTSANTDLIDVEYTVVDEDSEV